MKYNVTSTTCWLAWCCHVGGFIASVGCNKHGFFVSSTCMVSLYIAGLACSVALFTTTLLVDTHTHVNTHTHTRIHTHTHTHTHAHTHTHSHTHTHTHTHTYTHTHRYDLHEWLFTLHNSLEVFKKKQQKLKQRQEMRQRSNTVDSTTGRPRQGSVLCDLYSCAGLQEINLTTSTTVILQSY